MPNVPSTTRQSIPYSLLPTPYSLVLFHFFTLSLLHRFSLSTVHCPLSFVIQITVSEKSPIFSA